MQMRRSTVVGPNKKSVTDNIRTSYGTFLRWRAHQIVQPAALCTAPPQIHRCGLLFQAQTGRCYHTDREAPGPVDAAAADAPGGHADPALCGRPEIRRSLYGPRSQLLSFTGVRAARELVHLMHAVVWHSSDQRLCAPADDSLDNDSPRIATVLLYLRAKDLEGGETAFPNVSSPSCTAGYRLACHRPIDGVSVVGAAV